MSLYYWACLLMMLTFGSLYSGIGGADLGLTRAGFRCVWQAESNPARRSVLLAHWPYATPFVDVAQAVRTASPVTLVYAEMPNPDPAWLPPVFALVRRLQPAAMIVESRADQGPGIEATCESLGYGVRGIEAAYVVQRNIDHRARAWTIGIRGVSAIPASVLHVPDYLVLPWPDGATARVGTEAAMGFPPGWTAPVGAEVDAALSDATAPRLAEWIGRIAAQLLIVGAAADYEVVVSEALMATQAAERRRVAA